MSAYSIWVMEYAYVVKQPTSLFIYGAHNQGHRKMPYGYIVIKGHGRTMMVDVGYNHQAYGKVLAESYGVENWHPPQTVLAEVGVRPDEVSTVFQTHAHFDHMGNIEAFPNATFYIQERELSKWVWSMSLERRFRWLMLGIDPADIMRLVDLARQGRLVCVDGERENVAPGIDLHAAFDTHTWGSMYVTVRNDSVGAFRRCLGVRRRPRLLARESSRRRPGRPAIRAGWPRDRESIHAHHDERGDGQARRR